MMQTMCSAMIKHCYQKIQSALDQRKEADWFTKAYEIVYKMMTEALGIPPQFYTIGGSAALIGYGVHLGRIPHDIDVVVNKAIFYDVIEIISNSYMFTPARGSESSMAWSYPVEVKYKDDNKYIVDILGHADPRKFKQYKYGDVCLQDLQQIIDTKCAWNRRKDREDIDKIMQYMIKEESQTQVEDPTLPF